MSLKEFSADTGAAIVDQVGAPSESFAIVDLKMIVEHPRNVRTTFDAPDLEEMAETIRSTGINQPVLLRPLPASRMQETFEGRRKGDPLPTHELVDGARRYRASKLAGRTTIPALIKHLDDAQVLEVQLITALQRAGLTELDEAAGYQRLVDESGIPKEEIGDKIGKSRSYVYQRLKLLDLAPESRAALANGEIDASRALLIARIPDGKLQKKALAEGAKMKYDGVTPLLSVREFQRWLHDNVMLKLDEARFDIKDETLHATAGPCKACPKRTGADPDIFADVQGADICTDPKCFEAKANVHRDRLVAKAEAKGMTVIEGKAAKEICQQYSSRIEGYSRLDQKRTDVDESGPTLRKLLGKDAPAPVLIEHPFTKELIEAVPTAEAEAVLVAKGEIKPTATTAGSSLDAKVESLKSKEEHEGPKAIRAAAFQAIKDAVRGTADDATLSLITADLARVWLVRQVESFDAGEALVSILNLQVEGQGYQDQNDTAVAALQAASESNIFRALALFMASDEASYYGYSSREQSIVAMKAIAGVTGLDLDAVLEKATADRKTHLRSEIAMLKAKAAPKPPKLKQSAGSAAAAAASLAPKGKKKTTAPPAAQSKRGKKSKEEVQGEIALAFQKLDKAPDGAVQEGAADAAQGQDQAPDGAGEEEAAGAATLSPQALWPFPTQRASA